MGCLRLSRTCLDIVCLLFLTSYRLRLARALSAPESDMFGSAALGGHVRYLRLSRARRTCLNVVCLLFLPLAADRCLRLSRTNHILDVVCLLLLPLGADM